MYSDKNKSVIEKFSSNDEILTFAKNIIDTQNMILDKYKITNRIFDIQNIPIILPNATVKKQYSAKIDFESLRLDDMSILDFIINSCHFFITQPQSYSWKLERNSHNDKHQK